MPRINMALLARVDEGQMPSRCRVLRRERTTTSGRTSYGAEAVVAGPVDCRLEPSGLRPEEGERLGRIYETGHAIVALPLGTTVDNQDRIEVTTEVEATGATEVETFEVISDPFADSYATSETVVVKRED